MEEYLLKKSIKKIKPNFSEKDFNFIMETMEQYQKDELEYKLSKVSIKDANNFGKVYENYDRKNGETPKI